MNLNDNQPKIYEVWPDLEDESTIHIGLRKGLKSPKFSDPELHMFALSLELAELFARQVIYDIEELRK